VSGGPIRVVLVDDDPLVRAGLTLMLGGEFRAGARRDGGFAVFARLPIAGPAA